MRFLPALLPCLATVALTLPRGDADEPPLRLVVTIGGIAHELQDGQELAIEVGGKTTTLKVEVAAERHFAAGGVEFEFPRDMAFAFDGSGTIPQWTLDGDDVVLMVQSFPLPDAEDVVPTTLRAIAGALGQDAGRKDPEACTLTIGGRERNALRQRVAVAGGVLEVLGFAVGMPDGEHSVMVLVQHPLGPDGSPSAECERVLRLLAETFVVVDGPGTEPAAGDPGGSRPR